MGCPCVRRVVVVSILLFSVVTANHRGYKLVRLNNTENGSRLDVDKTFNYLAYMINEMNYDIDLLTKYDLLIGPWDFQDVIDTLDTQGISYDVVSLDVQELQDEEKLKRNQENPFKNVKSKQNRNRKRKRQTSDLFCEGYDERTRNRWIYENVVLQWTLSYCEIKMWMRMMERKYGNQMSLHLMGKSYEGRDIFYARISTTSQASDRKDTKLVVVEGGSHAREWAAVSSVLSFTAKLVKSLREDTNSSLSNYTFLIIPLLNPDGYEYSRNEDRLWRKNRAHTIDKACIGIDLNRNFNSNWSSCTRKRVIMERTTSNTSFKAMAEKQHKRNSIFCTPTYKGKHPTSEAETRAMNKLLIPLEGRVKAFFSLHSFGDLWLIPYGHSGTIHAPNHENSVRAAKIAIKQISKLFNTSFSLGNVLELIQYKACGSSMDWIVDKVGVGYAYTLEVTNSDVLGASSFNVKLEDLKKYGDILFIGVQSILEEVKKIEKEADDDDDGMGNGGGDDDSTNDNDDDNNGGNDDDSEILNRVKRNQRDFIVSSGGGVDIGEIGGSTW